MNIEELKIAILSNVVSITYKNKEGKLVTDPKCTLKNELLPERKANEGYTDIQKEAHSKLLTYYSLSKVGWRKLKYENYVSSELKD